MRHQSDFLVLGSGIAGLSFALQAARHGSVTVLAKRGRSESNTAHAQGGIAAVLAPQDSLDQHVQDTLIAGAGLCRERAVRAAVEEGPPRVRELIELGAEFTRDSTPLGYHLTREGGHSQRRVLHAADMTGREVERALLAAADRAGIRITEEQVAIDLITAAKLGAGDPDGDGFPEVLTQSVRSGLAFWNASGYPSPGWPKRGTTEDLRTTSAPREYPIASSVT